MNILIDRHMGRQEKMKKRTKGNARQAHFYMMTVQLYGGKRYNKCKVHPWNFH